MIKIKFSAQDSSIFIYFEDGDSILEHCDKDTALKIFELAQNNGTKEDIICHLNVEADRKIKETIEIKQANQLILDLVENLSTNDRFYVENGSLFRKGIPISIPLTLAKKIQSSLNNPEELNKLDSFWMWCSLIRKAESRESFYDYIEHNNMHITKGGVVIGFRRANFVGVSTNKGLQEFVSQQYLRLRKNKKSTTVYVYIDSDGTYKLNSPSTGRSDKDCIGSVKELYQSFSETTDAYESSHRGKDGKPLSYRIGQETRLKESEVDWSDAECSAGIHLHCGRYDDGSYGNSRLLVAFMPNDLVMCPYSDHTKLRVMAITPISILDNQMSYKDFQLTPEIEEIVDEMFANQLQRLEEMVTDHTFETNGITHTLIKEVPTVDFSKFLQTIKESVNFDTTKNRYLKV